MANTVSFFMAVRSHPLVKRFLFFMVPKARTVEVKISSDPKPWYFTGKVDIDVTIAWAVIIVRAPKYVMRYAFPTDKVEYIKDVEEPATPLTQDDFGPANIAPPVKKRRSIFG